MPLTIKLTKAQKEQFKKDILEKMKTLSLDEVKKAEAFIEEYKALQRNKTLTHDEFLTIVKAKICQDEYCKKAIHELQEKNQLEFDLDKAVSEFLKSKELPKTNRTERLEVLKIGRETILERKRMLIIEQTGEDPDPKFLGYSEDGKESVYELYDKCRNCKKVFKTYKSEWFCSPKCREEWVRENQNDRPLVQEEFAELNNESWDWERIGQKSDKDLGTYGIFRRAFKND